MEDFQGKCWFNQQFHVSLQWLFPSLEKNPHELSLTLYHGEPFKKGYIYIYIPYIPNKIPTWYIRWLIIPPCWRVFPSIFPSGRKLPSTWGNLGNFLEKIKGFLRCSRMDDTAKDPLTKDRPLFVWESCHAVRIWKLHGVRTWVSKVWSLHSKIAGLSIVWVI